MLPVISEHRFSNEELKNLKKKNMIVNYTLVPDNHDNYGDSLSKINNRLIYRYKQIVFKLEDYYYGTQKAIEFALFKKRSIKIITPEGSYMLHTLEDWKQSFKEGTIKHPVLQIFEEKRREYKEAQKAQQIKQQLEHIETTTEEEMLEFIHIFAVQYSIELPSYDILDISQMYQQLRWYFDNSLEYDLPRDNIYLGSQHPDDTPFFTENMFSFTQAEEYQTEYFGDQTYFEDTIYQEGRNYEMLKM